MKKEAGFFTFCGVLLVSLLGFQVLSGCGTSNLFPGGASLLTRARELYYKKDYDSAISLCGQITSDAGASSGDKQQANFFIAQAKIAKAGNSLIDIIVRGGNDTLKLSGETTNKDTASLIAVLIPTADATAKAQIVEAATAINQANIGTQDAQAINVAVVNTQAAVVKLTDAFDVNGDGELESTDVATLTAQQVTDLYVQANAGSTTFATSGGFSQFLDTALKYGGGALSKELSLESSSAVSGDAQSVHNKFINGEITGDQLSKFLTGK